MTLKPLQPIRHRIVDAFTLAYIEAALWSSTDGQGVPLDHERCISDIHWKTLDRMISDCLKFRYIAGFLYDHAIEDETIKANLDPDNGGCVSAGHDFWLTRNGHGAGFSDGDWGRYGKELREIARSLGPFKLYIDPARQDRKIRADFEED